MFRGSSYHKIDVKGRVIIPTRFRNVINAQENRGVMVSTFDGGLVAYPYKEWENVENKILSLARTSETMRRFRRVFIGGAFDCSCDKQGRILLPPSLRTYADLKKEIVLVGVLKIFEIWSRERWDAEHANLDEDFKNEEVRNEIAQLGL
ncbi:MAG: division/cell wall cluster transcriptional repressor MraZ [Desulfobacteraceae bacterium 4572_123]|nr:MAG: division/cell wall cluster transcriptional repressor MraZ [Desulfobacteraceae bacterium 4572_123]